MAGIQETKEALVGVNEIAVLLASRLKDGVQVDDFEAVYKKLFEDQEFRAAVLKAYENYHMIPGEVSDLDLFEIVELARVQILYVPKLVEAFKKVS